ncbi:metallophosphoesterase [Marinilabiliaceae bacterium JC040]|nr:metallophosphoesterase [Marinilabiliaceae bacterium JC040]
MRSSWIIFSIACIFILLENLCFYRFILRNSFISNKKLLKIVMIILTLLLSVGFFFESFYLKKISHPTFYKYVAIFNSLLMTIYLPMTIILLAKFFNFFTKKIFKNNIVLNAGYFVSIGVAMVIIWGATFGTYNYKVETFNINSKKIPESFNNFRIVHISDLHLGSHRTTFRGIKKVVDIINQLHPDVILFTGDMVNNFGEEIKPWINELKRMESRYGKFSILGNHDYGSYTKWKSKRAKQNNLNEIARNERLAGFQLLLDESRTISIDGDSINILGVQNWSLPPFPKYGNLQKAIKGVDKNLFTILLTHDPNHWEAEVKDTFIDLSLSGHTHAMQMGIDIFGKKWSPSKYLSKHWDGLYKYNEQYLNVNRGLGFVGFRGRILQRPAISLIILHKR